MSLNLPGLNLLERCAMYLLLRSPRVSLLVVKERRWPHVFTAVDQTDSVAMLRACWLQRDDEPLSMQFERLYHQPSYGEEE